MESVGTAGSEMIFRLGGVPVYFHPLTTGAPPRDTLPLEDGRLVGGLGYTLQVDKDGVIHVYGLASREAMSDEALGYAIRRLLANYHTWSMRLGVRLETLPLPPVEYVGPVKEAFARHFDGGNMNQLAAYARYLTRFRPRDALLIAARLAAVGLPPQPVWPAGTLPPHASIDGGGKHMDVASATDGLVVLSRLEPRVSVHVFPRLRELAPLFGPADNKDADEDMAALYEGVVRPRMLTGGAAPIDDMDRKFVSALLKLVMLSPNGYMYMTARERWTIVFFLALCGIETSGAMSAVGRIREQGSLVDVALMHSVFAQLEDWHPRSAAPFLSLPSASSVTQQ